MCAVCAAYVYVCRLFQFYIRPISIFFFICSFCRLPSIAVFIRLADQNHIESHIYQEMYNKIKLQKSGDIGRNTSDMAAE